MRWLIVLVAAVGLVALPASARAIPETGAGADTPGTTATVTTRSVHAGEVIGYRVTGFPAGQVINVKIDDGKFCPQAGTHGACVVQQQRIPASGAVRGSVQLPSDLTTGRHWLRFLASAPKIVDGQQVGTIGFTARGNTDFTVVAAASGSDDTASGGTGTPSDASSAASADDSDASSGAAASTPGATLSATPVAAASAPVATDSASAVATPSPATTAMAPADATVEEDPRFPVVGTVGLCVLVLLAGGLWLRSRRTGG